jgi:large subunit ribosomal protein L4
MIKVMKNLKIAESKTLLVLPGPLKNIILSGRNIQNLKISPINLINSYEILGSQKILFMEETLGVLEKTFLGKKEAVSEKTVVPGKKKNGLKKN